ncbi:hypothetical protein [Streptomyces sp. NPDC001889]
MRIRTVLAAVALAVAAVAGASSAASAATPGAVLSDAALDSLDLNSAFEFGDITVTTTQNPDVVVGCSPGAVLLSPSVQCGIFDIAPQ